MKTKPDGYVKKTTFGELDDSICHELETTYFAIRYTPAPYCVDERLIHVYVYNNCSGDIIEWEYPENEPKYKRMKNNWRK